MSMHKIPLTELERSGLKSHGLDIGTPSQLSDVFRHGVKFALAAKDAEIDALQAENERLRAAIVVMCDDGWLMCGVEGMSSAQEICYAAYLTINPTPKEQAT